MAENNVTLDDLGNTNRPRRRNTISIDLTPSGNMAAKADKAEDVEKASKKVEKLTPVNVGHVDMSSLEDMDIDAVLPRRNAEKVAESTKKEDDLMDQLDKAVAREKESITERINAITEQQRKELEEMQEKAYLAKEDNSDEDKVKSDDEDDDEEEYGFDASKYVDDTSDHMAIAIDDEDGSEEVDDYEESSDSGNEDTTEVEEEDDPTENDEETEPDEDKPETTVSIEKEMSSGNILNDLNDETIDDDIDDDDPDDNAEAEEESSAKILKEIGSQIKDKIAPIKKTIDLSKFTIAKKSMNAQKVMKLAIKDHQKIADWIMYSSRRPISVTGLSGPEILKLNPENSNRNKLNTFRDIFRIIYDHVYDANKPEFETWLKQTKFVDLQHIYFALYMATFGGSNFITYSCPNCKKVFIKDVPFENMIKYKDDSVKERVANILKMDTTSPSKNTYNVDLIQVSDSYVFGVRAPSLWNVVIETASLSEKFLSKHSDLIDIVSYIDSIYMIDYSTNGLIPVDVNADPNDQAKSSLRRIKIFYDIIHSLSSEEFYAFRKKLNEYDEGGMDDITYMIPGCNCPDCAAEIAANEEVGPDGMLFLRHQLAAFVNMPNTLNP